MYRLIHPGSRPELPLRMLFHPVADGAFLRACEAGSFRGLVAALLDDPGYESADTESRLLHRLRLAEDIALLATLDHRHVEVVDRDGPHAINVRSDEPLVRSLHRLGVVSLEPALAGQGEDAQT
jgi:hypothetical protein